LSNVTEENSETYYSSYEGAPFDNRTQTHLLELTFFFKFHHPSCIRIIVC